MRARQAPGGGRVIEVGAARLAGWFTRFGERHDGVVRTTLEARELRVDAGDGAVATVAIPFAPLAGEPGDHAGLHLTRLLTHLGVTRLVGLVLVRLGGHSVGIVRLGAVTGADVPRAAVLTSATGSRLVHGRAAAGGTSQSRFARRREGQARQALAAAAADIERVVSPRCGELAAVVLGGDRHALAELRARATLAPVFALASLRVLDVPEPRRAVLEEAAGRLLAVEIVVREP